ncbi:uncharacterized protein YukE [Nocardioides sp. BE266]|uniref:WXG100-like domain-containing protein n=1 Tax=Nocardioides sp. BE266 TaxID=2817725 RepID=UPI00285D392D|nr:hypothetical protein [Nocardioides sp. BE266]MDR7253456.1 uncharacterized protein YukE [Nocardioides sp. BE266]
MRLEIEAGAYDSAADALFSANTSVASAYRTLTGKLGGYHALGGDDTSSEDFVAGYDDAAAVAVQAMQGLVEALGNVATASATSGHNHRRANADSVYRRSIDAGPGNESEAEVVADFTPPSSLGGDNQDMPDWWNHVVDHLQGWGWPSANTDQLRDAASAWRAAASSVEAIGWSVDTAKSFVREQRSPEVDTATSVLSTLRTSSDDLATELRALGDACEDYASQVDQTRQTIKDLLKDLAIECGVTAGISVGLSFVTFGGAAAVGAGVIAARAIRYAKLVLAALRGLRAARAVGKIAVAAPKLKRVKDAFDKFRKARKIADTYRATRKGQRIGREALDAKQARNLKRFEKKLPGGAEDTAVSRLPNGNTQFTSNVPGRVPGSYAEYTKVVDEAGNTVKYIKTTYGPDGKIIHIKDKLGG